MKNFIYHENGWRWFEAEQLPVKPILWDEIRTEKYNNAISTLKAKSLPVHNNEICPQNISFVVEGQCYEWPGSVEVKETDKVIDFEGSECYPIYEEVAILKLPETKEKDMKTEPTPRRIRLDLMSPAEMAIYNAMLEVEKAGADTRLTAATIKLQEARDFVADFIDDVNPITK